MKKFLISALCGFGALLSFQAVAADCTYLIQDQKLCVGVEWIEGPKYDAYSKARVTFWNKDDQSQKPIAPAKPVVIYPWMIMPTMEHGARPVVSAELSPGVFEISKIYFMKMDGRWEMRVRYEGTDAKKEALVKVPVVLP